MHRDHPTDGNNGNDDRNHNNPNSNTPNNNNPDSNDGSRNNIARNNFLYPSSRYYGKFTPSHLVFNANLQEFAQRISFICALETGGKMSSEDAYQEVKRLYKQLKKSKKELGIGAEPSTEDF